MTLACVGISHHTAPAGMLEEFFFSEAEACAVFPQLKSLGISEGVLFSSPSRTELYVFSDQVELLADSLIYFLRKKSSIEANVPAANFFSLNGRNVIEHLLNVATGMDSMIVGDNHVLAQIRSGFELARQANVVGPVMEKLFETAFKCSERALRSTAISEGAISVSSAAVELAQHIFDNLKRKTALILGSGETVQQMGQYLKERGIGALYVTHTSAEKANVLATTLGGMQIPYDVFRERLASADIVLSSLQGAPFILSKQDIKNAEQSRTRGTLLLIDLGMPRNIDPFATELEQVFLYDLDTLTILVGENISRRRAEIPRVQSILAEELTRLEKSGKPWSPLMQSRT
ncbi:MAG: glutamyl-tRNA reductase [Ignavibacteriales bacterium]|nr:glutamyl-tRNA reductase [Ignavibacteriales bacterium]